MNQDSNVSMTDSELSQDTSTETGIDEILESSGMETSCQESVGQDTIIDDSKLNYEILQQIKVIIIQLEDTTTRIKHLKRKLINVKKFPGSFYNRNIF